MIWDWQFAWEIFPILLRPSLQVSLVITVLATLLAAALGLVMAVIRYSKVPVLSPTTSGFLQFIRARRSRSSSSSSTTYFRTSAS